MFSIFPEHVQLSYSFSCFVNLKTNKNSNPKKIHVYNPFSSSFNLRNENVRDKGTRTHTLKLPGTQQIKNQRHTHA